MTTRHYIDSNLVSDVLGRISTSPTAYHVIKNAGEMIDAEVLHERDCYWNIDFGKTYMVVRNDSTAAFFHVPEDVSSENACFEIAAVHADSPGFVVKHEPVIVRDGYVLLNVEEYGSPIRKTWLDRPLSIAGKVLVRDKKTLKIHAYLVDLREHLNCFIPTLAPHMGAADTDEVPVQSTMLPVIGNADSIASPEDVLTTALGAYMLSRYGIATSAADILDWELFLYNMEEPMELGFGDSSMVCAPRIDDQGCVWSAVRGFADMIGNDNMSAEIIPVLVIFDNEENGSSGYHAASSTFLSDVLHRIWKSLNLKEPFPDEFFESAIARSFMVSADNGHANHPNYPSKSDPTNSVVCGQGIVLKYAANQKYMTGSRSGAAFKDVCKREDIRSQSFHKHSDVRGGATLGNISAEQVSVPGCDIGLPQLAMHSAYEYCSKFDIVELTRFFYAFFSGMRDIRITTDDIICY